MRYSCEHCFRAINPRNSGTQQLSEVVRCDDCAGLMHAQCVETTCSKCGSSKLRKSPKVYSSQRVDRRLPKTLLVADEPQTAATKKRPPKQVKQKKVRQLLSNSAQIILVFTWIYLAIVTMSMPLVVDLLKSRVSSFELCVSFLVLPLGCLWVTWVVLRQKRWLSFLLFTAITTCTLGWIMDLSTIDPTIANKIVLAYASGFLLVILLLTMRARVKIRHKLIDQVEYTPLRFKMSLVMLGSIGILCGAIIAWLATYQLDRVFDISINHVEVPDVRQFLTLLLHASGLAVTVFCVTYFMLSGGPALRVFVSLVAVGLLVWHVQYINTQTETNDIVVYLVNSFPAEAEEMSSELSEEFQDGYAPDWEPAYARLFPAVAKTNQELSTYKSESWPEINNLESIPLYLLSEAVRLSGAWLRLAFVMMLVLLPLRILGYSLAIVALAASDA